MNFASKTAPVRSTMPSSVAAIQPIIGWRTHLWTSVTTCPVALVPLAVQVLSREPQLDKEIARMVLRLQVAPLFSPEAPYGGPDKKNLYCSGTRCLKR